MTVPVGVVINVRDAGAIQLLRQLERQLATLRRSQTAATRSTVQHTLTLQAWRRQVLGVVTAYKSIQFFGGFIREGLKFNATVETARLGIASLIAATSKLTTSDGQLLTGTRALSGAMSVAAAQVVKLRVAGLQTAATTEELVQAFQNAVGPGLAAGLAIDQIRVFTVQLTQAAAALGVPMFQLNEEVRSILSGTITFHSRVAKALQITNREIKQARSAGTLAQFLEERFRSFSVAGEEASKTLTVLRQRAVETFQVFAGQATEPLAARLKEVGNIALNAFFDFDRAQVSKEFQAILDVARSVFSGDLIARFIEGGVEKAKELNVWLQNNRVAVEDTIRALDEVVRAVGDVISSFVGVFIEIVKVETETGTLAATFRAIAAILRTIADNMKLVVTGFILFKVGAVALAAATAATFNPIITAIGLAALAIGGLTLAYTSSRIEAERLAEANRQLVRTHIDEGTQTHTLIGEYEELNKELTQTRKAGQDTTDVKRRMEAVLREIIRLNPRLAAQIRAEESNYKSLTEVLKQATAEKKKAMEADLVTILNQYILIRAQKERLRLEIAEARARGQNVAKFAILEQFLTTISRGFGAGLTPTARVTQTLGELVDQLEDATGEGKSLEEQMKAVAAAIRAMQGEDEITITTPPPKEDPVKAFNDIKQFAEATAREQKALLDRGTAELDRQLAANTISYRRYFELLMILERSTAAEQIRAHKAVRDAAVDPGDRRIAESKIVDLQEGVREAQADAIRKELKLNEELVNDLRQLDIQRMENEGKITEARTAEIALQNQVLLQRLQAENNLAGIELMNSLFRVDIARAKLESIEVVIEQARGRISRGEQSIQTRLAAHTISQRQAREELTVIYRRELTVLQAQLPILAEIAIATGDVAKRAAVEEMGNEIEQLNQKLRETAEEWVRIGNTIHEAAVEGISDFLNDAIDNVNGLASALAALALSIAESLRSVLSGIIAEEIVGRSRELLSQLFNITQQATGPAIAAAALAAAGQRLETSAVGLGAAGGTLLVAGGIWQGVAVQLMAAATALGGVGILEAGMTIFSSIPFLASGGPVRGPSGTDKVPAWLTQGEYVIRREIVQAQGKVFFDEINAGRKILGLPDFEFASGGPVHGPGGIDQVPAWLTQGEYVIRREIVQAQGRKFFDEINAGRKVIGLPDFEFARGGPVHGLSGIDRVPARLAQGEYVIYREVVRTQGERFFVEINVDSSSQVFASGGPVRGPQGTDKVPAKLTAGEYVIRREIVRTQGERFFDEINAGRKVLGLPDFEFVSGGPVKGLGGTDKVPARLTAGEYVIRREIVQKYGQEVFDEINSSSSKVLASRREIVRIYGQEVFDKINSSSSQVLASGGQVHGPSGIDQVPAWLTRGEYVIRREIVRARGKNFFDEINAGRRLPPVQHRGHKFASGGLVEGTRTTSVTGSFDGVIGLEEGLVARHLETTEGTRVIIKQLGKNKNAARTALGLR